MNGGVFLAGARAPLAVKRIHAASGYDCTGPASGYVTHTLTVQPADERELVNVYLDLATRDADRDRIEPVSSYRDGAPHR